MTDHKRGAFHPELGAMLAAALLGDIGREAEVIELKLDGNGPVADQVERAMEEAAARHRATCATCRELHAENGPADDTRVKGMNPAMKAAYGGETTAAPDLKTFTKDKLAAQHKAEIMALEKKHAAEREELIASFESKAEAAPEMRVIGHAVFYNGQIIASSFDEDVERVARTRKIAVKLNLYKDSDIEVKPVFAQF